MIWAVPIFLLFSYWLFDIVIPRFRHQMNAQTLATLISWTQSRRQIISTFFSLSLSQFQCRH
jgi:hypothetical protein